MGVPAGMTPGGTLVRCDWAEGTSDVNIEYHDTEWGVPERDPAVLFEFLILEGAQAGLSWTTILNKRAGYGEAFAGFDAELVAAFGDDDIDRLLGDRGIVRNRAKVTSAIANARAWLALDDPAAFMWDFVGGAPLRNAWRSTDEVPASTPQSEAMSKELKRRGFRFVGPTICYAWMQACGLVNDHIVTCFRQGEIVRAHPNH